jgi:hypothetical protein
MYTQDSQGIKSWDTMQSLSEWQSVKWFALPPRLFSQLSDPPVKIINQVLHGAAIILLSAIPNNCTTCCNVQESGASYIT